MTKIQFKRGLKDTLTRKLVGENILAQGEPAYETNTGKLKIGDGIHNYEDLPYISGGEVDTDIVNQGYYFDGAFYKDIEHKSPFSPSHKKLYIDLISKSLYYYDYLTTEYTCISGATIVPDADENTKGIMKLYQGLGTNTDGTINQTVLSQMLESIKFKAVRDESITIEYKNLRSNKGAEEDTYYLELDKQLLYK